MSESREFVLFAEAEPPFFAGVDLGGTNIKLGIVDSLARPLAYEKLATEVEKGPHEAVLRIRDALDLAIGNAGLAPEAIARVGLGSPGPLDTSRGVLVSPGNLQGWWGFPLAEELAKALGVEVTLANDANAAAYGEFWAGRGRDWHSLILYTLGTGVGGGMILGDALVTGQRGNGGELGHMIIDPDGDARLCSCGHRGHVEAYASATALVERTHERLAAGYNSRLEKQIAAGDELTALAVYRAAEEGDELALAMIDETATYLAIGIANVIHAVEPEGVLLGGAMTFGKHEASTGRRFLERVRQATAERAIPSLYEVTTIDYAELGNDAGYIGAAGLAQHDYQHSLAGRPRSSTP